MGQIRTLPEMKLASDLDTIHIKLMQEDKIPGHIWPYATIKWGENMPEWDPPPPPREKRRAKSELANASNDQQSMEIEQETELERKRTKTMVSTEEKLQKEESQ